jgi:sirohydrochlorin ferrochelatase
MLDVMETPAHERRQIEDYLRSQSGDDFEIEHVEKLTSEYVLGHQYDVWDAHTSDGRWWVITNPVNLYSQDQVKSMDIALSFHIGLMSRMMASSPRLSARQGTWVLEVARRLDVAGESLDRAREVEDFQAVGMRLRETLLTLAAKLAGLGYQTDASATDLQQGNFKAWASVCAESVAVGSSAQHLRALLKTLSEKTWNYAAWLTHARSASRPDAQIALAAVSQTIEAFIVAVNRHQLGTPLRCPVCASYQLRTEPAGNGGWMKVCETCGWEAPAEPAPLAADHDLAGEDGEAKEADSQPALEGECVEPRDLGIYLSPGQARAVLEQAGSRTAAESVQEDWANPFAFFFPEDASLVDVHRIAYTAFVHGPAEGTELAYACEEAACVNPGHAREIPLPGETRWMCGIVEKVTCRPNRIELHISTHGNGSQRVFMDHAILNRYGFGDASSLAERVVFFTQPDNHGWVRLLPVQRRADYADGSTTAGWLHPIGAVTGDQDCPCGSEQRYSACHGATIPAGDHTAAS